MKVDTPVSTGNKPGGRHRRPTTLDRNGLRKDGDAISPVNMKTGTGKSRRRQPKKPVDPQRGHMLDVTA